MQQQEERRFPRSLSRRCVRRPVTPATASRVHSHLAALTNQLLIPPHLHSPLVQAPGRHSLSLYGLFSRPLTRKSADFTAFTASTRPASVISATATDVHSPAPLTASRGVLLPLVTGPALLTHAVPPVSHSVCQRRPQVLSFPATIAPFTPVRRRTTVFRLLTLLHNPICFPIIETPESASAKHRWTRERASIAEGRATSPVERLFAIPDDSCCHPLRMLLPSTWTRVPRWDE